MYLYFNKEGILSTIIPHGETVRQGSYLNIYVLLDDDFFVDRGESIEQYSVNVELAFPNNTIGTVSTVPVNEPKLLPFEKLDDSEITYELIDGAQYWTYHFRFTPNQATLYAGKIFAMVSVMQTELTDPDNIESAIEKDLLYYGKADIYVEKVFGIAKRMVDESQLHYKNLVIQLNELNKRKAERLNISLTGNPIKNLLYKLISGRYNGTYVVNGEYTAKCTLMNDNIYSVQLQTLNAEGKIIIYRCTDNAETVSEDTLVYNDTILRDINIDYNDNGVMLINGEEVIKDTAILDEAIKIKLDEHDNNISNLQTDLVTAKSDISTLKTDVEVLKQSGGSGSGSSGGSGSVDTTRLEAKIGNLENSVNELNVNQENLSLTVNTNKINISTITTTLVNKADKSDLTLINAELINKASKTDLNNAVVNINSNKVTNEQLNNTLVNYVSNSNLSEELEKKVDTSVFDNFSTSTNNSLSGKLSISEFNKYKTTNTENLSKLEASTKTYADNKVSELVGSSPEALNTLQELAEALGNNENFSTTVLEKIGENETKISGLTTDFSNLNKSHKNLGLEVENNTNKIGTLTTTIEDKADKSELTPITGDISDLKRTVEGNSTNLNDLTITIGNKANKEEITAINTTLNSQSTIVGKINDLTLDLDENSKSLNLSKILSIKYQNNIQTSGLTISSLASQRKEGMYFVEGDNTPNSEVTGRAKVIFNNDGSTATQTWYGKTGNIYKRAISTSAMINSANPDSSWGNWVLVNGYSEHPTYYKHSIFLASDYSYLLAYITVYCKKSVAFTYSSFATWLISNNHTSGNPLSCSGAFSNNIVLGVYASGSDIYLSYSSGSSVTSTKISSAEATFTDKFIVVN